MANSDDKSKPGDNLRDWLNAIFGFRNKMGDVLDHWVAFNDLHATIATHKRTL